MILLCKVRFFFIIYGIFLFSRFRVGGGGGGGAKKSSDKDQLSPEQTVKIVPLTKSVINL